MDGTGGAVPRMIRRGAKSARRTGPGMIRRGRKSVTGGTGGAGPGMIRQGRRARVGRAPELSVGEERIVTDGTGGSGPGMIRQGRRTRVGLAPELSVGDERSVMDRTGGSGPGMIRQGQRACWTGRVASTPELFVAGPGWLRLWGVADSPSVDTLSEGDAPSSLELTVGANGDAVDWNASRGVTYGRCGGI